jgi:hypothetical protein
VALRSFGLQERLALMGDRSFLSLESAVEPVAPASLSPSSVAPATSLVPVPNFHQDNLTGGHERQLLACWSKSQKEDTIIQEETDEFALMGDSLQGPLAQFLATGALSRSQSGWWKATEISRK